MDILKNKRKEYFKKHHSCVHEFDVFCLKNYCINLNVQYLVSFLSQIRLIHA